MRNLWQLLVRNHVFILFLASQLLALSWVARSHGYPRGVWVRWCLSWTGAWNEQVMQLAHIQKLSVDNARLVQENADLKAQIGHPSAVGTGAEIVKATWWKSANYFIINRGENDGIQPGDGVVSAEGAVGRILETSDAYALGVPLITTELEWSGRVGKEGTIGRVIWEGPSPLFGRMMDIARSASIAVGDTVFSTGYQGVFLPDVPLGTVQRVTQNPAEEFLTVQLNWLVDFQSIRYVEVISKPALPHFEKEIEESEP